MNQKPSIKHTTTLLCILPSLTKFWPFNFVSVQRVFQVGLFQICQLQPAPAKIFFGVNDKFVHLQKHLVCRHSKVIGKISTNEPHRLAEVTSLLAYKSVGVDLRKPYLYNVHICNLLYRIYSKNAGGGGPIYKNFSIFNTGVSRGGENKSVDKKHLTH